MLLTIDQARAVQKAMAAPNCTFVEMVFNTDEGEVAAHGPLDQYAVRVYKLLGDPARETYTTPAEFAHAYMLLPPLGCPIEDALAMAVGIVQRVQQRHQSTGYNFTPLFDAVSAARKELKRIKS